MKKLSNLPLQQRTQDVTYIKGIKLRYMNSRQVQSYCKMPEIKLKQE